MTDWKAIIEDQLTDAERGRLARFMAEADGTDPCNDGYVAIHNAGGWTWRLDGAPATPEQTGDFLASLVELRSVMNRQRAWRHIIDLTFAEAAEKVIGIIERETGISTEEVMPAHLDPEKLEGVAVAECEEAKHEATMARIAERHRVEAEAKVARAAQVAADKEARRARRRRAPVRVADPGRQLVLDFPSAPDGPPQWKMTRLPSDYKMAVIQLMDAWRGSRPSPITKFLAAGVRSYIEDGVLHEDLWAHVRLVGKKRARIIFRKHTNINEAPFIIYNGGDLQFDHESKRWTYADIDSTVDEHSRVSE